MASSTLTLSFKIADGKVGLKSLTADAEGLAKAMQSVVSRSESLKKGADMAGVNMMLSNINGAVSQLSSSMHSLTGDAVDFSSAMREVPVTVLEPYPVERALTWWERLRLRLFWPLLVLSVIPLAIGIRKILKCRDK